MQVRMFGVTEIICKFVAMETNTRYFSVRPRRYVGKAMPRWLARRGWPLLAVAAAIAVAGLADARWLVVALIVLCAAAPAALAIVFFHGALSPRAAMQTLEHEARVDPDALVVTFLPAPGRERKPWRIAAKDIRNVERDGDFWLVWTASEPLVPVMIPDEYIKKHIGEESWHNFCRLVCYEE